MKKIRKFFPIALNRIIAFVTLYMLLFSTVYYPVSAAEYKSNNTIAYGSGNKEINNKFSRGSSIDKRLTEKLGRVNDKFQKIYNNRENFKSNSAFDMGDEGKLFWLEKYGETIINYMGLTLTIPENSAPKDSYITIIPLTKDELVNIPSDVYNVTYSENGMTYIGYDIRLNGSSSNKFRKNIEISFKYNDSAYKDKAIDNAVFIYYFDEENYKWEKVNRKNLDKYGKRVSSLIDHFCQIYAGLMSMQTEPPQAKGINTKPINIAAVDPLAGYKGVAPPRANNKGTANVSYPIAVPEGINGMTPNISINYSSANKDGDCGYGWNLNTSKIEIKTKNKGIPAYTDVDILMLDDEELVKITSDSTTKTYRYKVERDFSKIVYQTSSKYFIVYKTDGGRLYYGINTSERVYTTVSGVDKIFAWYLSKIEDKFGNFITYSYDKDNNQPFLSEIKYAYKVKTDLSSNLYTITFTSKEREIVDNKESYISAFQVYKTKMLDYITVNYNTTSSSSTRLIKYQLDHTAPGFAGKSVLNYISEIKGLNAGETEVEINKSSFNYSSLSTDKFVRDDNYNIIDDQNVLFYAINHNDGHFTDLNNDGYIDYYKVFTEVRVDPDEYIPTVLGYVNKGYGIFSPLINNTFTDATYCHEHEFDYNDDGYLDMLLPNNCYLYTNNNYNYYRINYNHNASNACPIYGYSNPQDFYYMDMNCDGRKDYISPGNTATLSYEYKLKTGDGTIDTTPKTIVSYNTLLTIQSSFAGFADMNGDGLQDAIFKYFEPYQYPVGDFCFTKIYVFFNKGNSFTQSLLLDGYPYGNYSNRTYLYNSASHIQFPADVNGDYTFNDIKFIDINNDGLTDLVFKPKSQTNIDEETGAITNNKVYVSYNLGVYNNSDIIKFSDMELLYQFINTGGHYQSGIDFIDINGDGYPDARVSETGLTQPIFLINQMGNKNLLIGIENEKTGVKTELAYDWKFLDPNRETTNYYKKEYVLTEVKTGLLNATGTAYTIDTAVSIDYENGIYDRLEREFRGFEKVTATVHDKDKGSDHITETTYAAGAYTGMDSYNINKLYDQYFKDQVIMVESMIKTTSMTLPMTIGKVKYVYEKGKVFGETSSAGYKDVKFSYIRNTYAWMYDNNGVYLGSGSVLYGDLISIKEYAFNTDITKGLITQIIETSEGDPHHEKDDTSSKTTFVKSTTQWINAANETTSITIPVNANTVLSTLSFTTDSIKLGNTKYYYDDSAFGTVTAGKLTKEEVWNNNGSYNIISEYNYDAVYGYVSQVSTRSASETKSNNNSMRYSYQFNQNGYSMTATATYPDNLTETSYFDSYGRLKKSTNRYGDNSEVDYDNYGRVWRVQETIDGETDLEVTKLFEYSCDATNKIFKAVSKSLDDRDAAGDDRYYFVQVYCDGLGRVIQTYTEGEIESSSTTHTTDNVWIKSGQALYDEMGRVTKAGSVAYEDFVINNGFDAEIAEEESDLAAPVTSYIYDNYGRPDFIRVPSKNSTYIDIKYNYSATDENVYNRFVDNADNSTTNAGYRILTETKVEARDNTTALLRESTVYQDLFGACVKTRTLTENNGTSVYNTTEFDYNLLGRSKVKQNNGNVGVKEFDSLGRIKYLKSPDAGTKIYTYKDNGLLDKVLDHGKTVGSLEQTQVYFSYDNFYRINDIKYNNSDANDNYIKYEYYDAVDGNDYDSGTALNETKYARSSIKKIMKGNAANPYYKVLYKYDQFSINEIKTIDGVRYDAGYLYDIQGRIKTYTMPESSSPEVLTYTYNNGGMLYGITSNKDSISYIENINYDKNGQRVYMKYGNDSEMTYTYDPVTMLLDRYVVKDGAGTDILDYNYNFDITGNITNITDQIQAGGQNKSTQTYGYDNMGRLINGIGSYKGDSANLVDAVRNPAYYNVAYAYDSDNRMTSQTYKNSSGAAVTTMTFNYLAGSHALDNIALTGSPDNISLIDFTYDDFGNMKSKIKYEGSTPKETMGFNYDLNNSLIHIDLPENGETLDFTYDIKGQRIKKIYKDDEGSVIYSNTYVNGFYTVNNEGGTLKVSKHISDGNKIIATKVNNDSSKIMYYHQNHIGSTAIVTDTTGNKFQSYLYMPYGETWVLEKGALYNGDPADGEIGSDAEIEHLFTGQVFDKESKLYYYNARYYDATVGMFITPDPMMSGLNHYAYASCNPVMYSDPTGYSEDDDGGGGDPAAPSDPAPTDEEEVENCRSGDGKLPLPSIFNGVQISAAAYELTKAWENKAFIVLQKHYSDELHKDDENRIIAYTIMYLDEGKSKDTMANSGVNSTNNNNNNDPKDNNDGEKGGGGGNDDKTLYYFSFIKMFSTITSPFGPRIIDGKLENHLSMDVDTPNIDEGISIYVPEEIVDLKPTLTWDGWDTFYGLRISLHFKYNNNNITMTFSHVNVETYNLKIIQKAKKNGKKGVRVKSDKRIGYSGNTGRSYGDHIDLQILRNEEPVDPFQYYGIFY